MKSVTTTAKKITTLSKRGENVFSRDTFEPRNMSPNNYYNSPHPDSELPGYQYSDAKQPVRELGPLFNAEVSY